MPQHTTPKKNPSWKEEVRGGEGVVPQNPRDDIRQQPQLQKKFWCGRGGGGEGRKMVPQKPQGDMPQHTTLKKILMWKGGGTVPAGGDIGLRPTGGGTP